MSFCMKCGQQLADGVKFCSNCGASVKNTPSQPDSRKISYDGEIYKCPSCGMMIGAYMVNCPFCKIELRSRKKASAVYELTRKLQQIEDRQFIETEESDSIIKTIFGKDLNSSQRQLDAAEKREEFNNQKEKDKIDAITHFIIPNTKGDIIDFLLLADSNVNSSNKRVKNAWRSKRKQVYKQAEMLLSKDADFEKYKSSILEKQSKKKRKILIALITILSIIIAIALAVSIFDYAENKKNEETISQIEILLEQNQFEEARLKAEKLSNKLKSDMLSIIKEKENDFYGRIKIGLSHNDFYEKDYLEMKALLELKGFTNIKLIPIKDLITGWVVSDGSIEKVLVDGDSYFYSSEYFMPDVEIIIQYHTFK